MPKTAEAEFDDHEKPTAPHGRTVDPNATMKMAKVDLDELVRKESGTRRSITAAQIDAFVRDREFEGPPEPPPRPQADVQSTAQQIPIDVDLTAMRRGVDPKRLIAIITVIAVVLAALVGFLAGRISG